MLEFRVGVVIGYRKGHMDRIGEYPSLVTKHHEMKLFDSISGICLSSLFGTVGLLEFPMANSNDFDLSLFGGGISGLDALDAVEDDSWETKEREVSDPCMSQRQSGPFSQSSTQTLECGTSLVLRRARKH
jgi:hypothetical protein